MQENSYISLLAKSFAGQNSPEEQAALDQWLAQSPANEQYARELREAWEGTMPHPTPVRVNLDADFREVRAKIAADAAPMRATTGGLARRLLRVAAIGAALVAAAWFWWGRSGVTFDQMAAADGLKRIIHLEDGTEVCLKEGSSMEYPTAFRGASRRQVRLQGQAFFKVAHDPAHPFQVLLADGGVVEVLGTSFDVQSSATAPTSSVLVKTGRVRFQPKGSGESVVLIPAQKAVFNKSTGKMQVSTVPNFNDLAWYAEELEFVKTPLSEVLTRLEDYGKSSIKLENTALGKCLYTSPLTLKLNTGHLESVLEIVAVPFGLRVERQGEDKFVLRGGTCPR